MKNIWIVMPAYNEEKYITDVIDKVRKRHRQLLVVNDGSSDGTLQQIKQKDVTYLSHQINLGKGAAMKTGCDYAFKNLQADAVILMDSDDQHNPNEIEAFVRNLNKGFDVVLGVRNFSTNSSMPKTRMLGNRFASLLIRMVCGVYLHDIPSGFKAFTSTAYEKIKWSSTGYEVETEMSVRLAKSNLRFIEIPIQTIYHDADKGVTLLDSINILMKLPLWLLS